MRCRGCSEHTSAPLLPQPVPDYAPASAPTPESGFGARGVAAATGQANLGYGRAERPKLLGGASQVWGAAGAQTAATAYGELRGLGGTRWGPSPRAPGFPSAESRRRPAPNTGVSASGGVRRAALPAVREAAGERSLKNLPPGTLKRRTRRLSAVRLARAERKGREGKGPSSTHGSWRRQRLQPASVASPRSGRRCRPRPLRATPPSRLLPPAPSRPDADSHWAEQNTWSAVPRASPGGRRAELGGRSAGRGAGLPGSAGSGR